MVEHAAAMGMTTTSTGARSLLADGRVSIPQIAMHEMTCGANSGACRWRSLTALRLSGLRMAALVQRRRQPVSSTRSSGICVFSGRSPRLWAVVFIFGIAWRCLAEGSVAQG